VDGANDPMTILRNLDNFRTRMAEIYNAKARKHGLRETSEEAFLQTGGVFGEARKSYDDFIDEGMSHEDALAAASEQPLPVGDIPEENKYDPSQFSPEAWEVMSALQRKKAQASGFRQARLAGNP